MGAIYIMSENTKPNLFDYATKELSQDAVICWLIHWASDYCLEFDRELNRLGRRFVLALLNKHGVRKLPERIETKICQQDKGIDVLAKLSELGPVLLIEDKTDSHIHGKQLENYYNFVIDGKTRLEDVAKEYVYPIYLKTGNQSLAMEQKIKQASKGLHRPYKIFSRSDFLDVLRHYEGEHQALKDYRDHLERYQTDTESFRSWKEQDSQSNWSWASWEGFYRFLENELGDRDGDWGYVSNPSGGFNGFWWNFIDISGSNGSYIYLQLEVDPTNRPYLLCFKVGSVEKEKQQQMKWKWHERILEAGGGRVVKPKVMRVGKTMTVGRWKDEWLAFNGKKIDLSATVENLKEAGKIIERAAKMVS